MKYVTFLMLCWKAYNGDPKAALEVIGVLKDKVEGAVSHKA